MLTDVMTKQEILFQDIFSLDSLTNWIFVRCVTQPKIYLIYASSDFFLIFLLHFSNLDKI